jgi:beta-fructofuranosidase
MTERRLFLYVVAIVWAGVCVCRATATAQTLVSHFNMELNSAKTQVKDIVSGRSYIININNDHRSAENVAGAVGNALRFDGFSTRIPATIDIYKLSNQALSMSLWLAVENYPMMDVDGIISNTITSIAGNLKDDAKSGFAFVMSGGGKYGFECYIDGSKIAVYAPDNFPRYEWVHLQATAQVSTGTVTVKLWANGTLVNEQSYAGSSITLGGAEFLIGRDFKDSVEYDGQTYSLWTGEISLNSINGLIDEVKVYNGIQPAPQCPAPEHAANLSIPQSRFENDIHRPRFHAMPAANWTNEPYGLIYYNNLWHLFFQKNGNGPYWGRIAWGHLISEDLVHWTELKTALNPDEDYDSRGCWSGCIYQDEGFNDNVPQILYTAVDQHVAQIIKADPLDGDNLIDWEKKHTTPVTPTIPGHFRDPFVYKTGGNYYMIVGADRNGKGSAALYEYDKGTETWRNNGHHFYTAATEEDGVFWEMPAVMQLSEDKWAFFTTPIFNPNTGTQLIYYLGTMNPDGTFNSESSTPTPVDAGGISDKGFGFLQITPSQKSGKNIGLGVVTNGSIDGYPLGWAHMYCLPRQFSLDANGNLLQKPVDDILPVLRENAQIFEQKDITLNNETLNTFPVSGRTAEIQAEFIVSGETDQKFGFYLRKKDNNYIELSYSPQKTTDNLVFDVRSSTRIHNDDHTFQGLYEGSLDHTFATGDTVRMQVFIDHSIFDIFINDRWAFTMPAFPTDADANGIEVFSDRLTVIPKVTAYKINYRENPVILQTEQYAAQRIRAKISVYVNDDILYLNTPYKEKVSIFTIDGRLLKEVSKQVGEVSIPFKIQTGIYIVSGQQNGWATKIVKN